MGSTGGYTPDIYDVQSWVAELADAGCEAIVLGVEPDGDEDDIEEVITLCKELDVLGVPMRYRLGLRFDRSVDDSLLLGMCEQALDSGVMRFDTCARGHAAVLPSLLLAALGGAGGDQSNDEGADLATTAHIKLHDLIVDR